MSLTIPNSPYGRWPRRHLDGYAPIPYERHRRDYGKGYDEYLVEEHDDGTVTLLPSDAMLTPWRTLWRKTTPARTGRKETDDDPRQP